MKAGGIRQAEQVKLCLVNLEAVNYVNVMLCYTEVSLVCIKKLTEVSLVCYVNYVLLILI